MRTVILLTVVFLAIVGLGAIGLTLLMKRLNTKYGGEAGDESEDPTITEAQKFLPFEDIREGVIVLPGHRYRAVLECGSLNYTLKTGAERELIEVSFQQFLNSLPCPITLFTQTKLIDNSKRQRMLEESVKKVLEDYPQMEEYATQYQKDMANLSSVIGNSLQKKRYIIVPYDDVGRLGELSEEEKVHYAAREIRNRCNIIKTNLDAVGVNSSIMDTRGLVELVYSSYHRDNFSFAEAIADGDAFALFVDGEKDLFAERPKEAEVDQVLAEAINKLQLSGEDGKGSKEVLEGIRTLRDKYAGYYKGGTAA